MNPARQLALRWIVGATLTLIVAAVALREGRTLRTLEVRAIDPARSFDEPRELAERVRYSEPFDVHAPLLVVDAHGRAGLLLSLVEEAPEGPPAVAETTLAVRGQARARFADVRPGRYRLRVLAEGRGPVTLTVSEGGVSPLWAALAATLVLLPAAVSTGQWMRGRILR